MAKRTISLTDKLYYHICNKSIAGYRMLEQPPNIQYFLTALDYYRQSPQPLRLSLALRSRKYEAVHLLEDIQPVRILGYCIMPTHYHLVLRVDSIQTLSRYVGVVENSYSRFYNIKNARPGPLWQTFFRRIPIYSNEQLLHVLRYIHLNPTTSNLCERPELWPFSSYADTISNPKWLRNMPEISISNPSTYKRYVENNIAYQRSLHGIKKHIMIAK